MGSDRDTDAGALPIAPRVASGLPVEAVEVAAADQGELGFVLPPIDIGPNLLDMCARGGVEVGHRAEPGGLDRVAGLVAELPVDHAVAVAGSGRMLWVADKRACCDCLPYGKSRIV